MERLASLERWPDSLSDPVWQSWFDATPTGLLLIAADGRIAAANAMAAAIFGADCDALRQRPLGELIPEMSSFREQRWPVGDARLLTRSEVAGRDGRGRPIPLAIGWQPLGEGGEVLCSVLDMTPFKQAEQEFARFFDLSLDLMCIADLEGRFRRVNPNFSRLLGYNEEQLTSQPFLTFVHPEDRQQTMREMERLSAGGDVVQFRNRYRDARGNDHWLEWNARAVPGEDLCFAVARDVTDRIVIEQQLAAQEVRERAILDNTGAVIYVKDLQGRYQFINREFSRLFNISVADAQGRSDFDIFPPAMAHVFEQNDRAVLDSRSTLKVEEIAPHPDGPHVYLSVKFPLFDAAGEPHAVAGISTDVTDRIWLKRTADELRSAKEVQRRLYPRETLELPGFDIAGSVSAASQLCGDYYDYVARPDGTVTICVGDVSGHGLGPALEMVETRALLRMLLKTTQPLPAVVGTLNQLLCADTPESSFLTLFLAELDPVRRQLHYIGAGHDAWLFRTDGRVQRLESTGMVVALFESATFPLSESLVLDGGDLILICTDGLHEAMSPDRELFGLERLCEAVQRHRQEPAAILIGELFAEVRRFTGQAPVRDDMTAVAVRVR